MDCHSTVPKRISYLFVYVCAGSLRLLPGSLHLQQMGASLLQCEASPCGFSCPRAQALGLTGFSTCGTRA